MYNGPNVQPQLYNTGHGGSDNGESKDDTRSSTANELPAPVPSSAVPPQAAALSAVVPPQPQGEEGGPWIQEVEQLFDRTKDNPRQRAEEFNEMRRRYLRDVVGVPQNNGEDTA